jgi:hypothetical protein
LIKTALSVKTLRRRFYKKRFVAENLVARQASGKKFRLFEKSESKSPETKMQRAVFLSKQPPSEFSVCRKKE